MTLEKDRVQTSGAERVVHVLLVETRREDARRLHTAVERIPAFQVHSTRDFAEGQALLESRTFDVAIVGGSPDDEAVIAFTARLREERPEMAVLLFAAGSVTSADPGNSSSCAIDDSESLASHIRSAVRTAGSSRRRETMVRWLEQEMRVDHLTGLYNRKTFYDRLAEVCTSSSGGQAHVTLIVLDVVGTRMVNEAHGAEAGDAMIQRAAAGIMRSVRGADFAARIDGDDFGIILPNADFELGQRVARRIAHELDRLNANEWQGQVPVEVSFGVATGTDCSSSELLEAAMKELARCKDRSTILTDFPHFDAPDDPSVA